MGATAAAVTLAVVGAAAGGASAYMSGKAERDMMKQQYKIDEYNAQMDKAEKEIDLARQDKLLQKQLAESMAMTNNFFGGNLEGDASNLLFGAFDEGQEEARELRAQEQYVQNRYITGEAIRRKAFNKNMRNNAISTGLNIISGAVQGGFAGYTAGSGLSSGGGKPPVKDVTGTFGNSRTVRVTNASYRG